MSHTGKIVAATFRRVWAPAGPAAARSAPAKAEVRIWRRVTTPERSRLRCPGVGLLTPTYPLFPEIARRWTETPLDPGRNFALDLAQLEVPAGTTLVVIVDPKNPNGGTFDMAPLPDLLRRHSITCFLVDEAFIDLGGQTAATLVEGHANSW